MCSSLRHSPLPSRLPSARASRPVVKADAGGPGWSTFASMLQYKAALYGRDFRRIGRWEPTSQVCSTCGVKDGPKPLSVRGWECAARGAVHDRDLNAAKNILALGRRERLNARGGQVRPAATLAQADEAGSRRRAA